MFYINIVLLIIGVVLLILSIITSPTQQAQQDSTAQPTVPVSDDGNSTSTGGETTASSGSGGNWWLIALLVVGVIGGMIFWWQPWQANLNPEEQALIRAGWVTILVSKPDSQGFSSVAIPKEMIGKKIVIFRSCSYTQTRSNGVESQIWTPRTSMYFSTPIKEWFVDVKFEKVPADGKCWAKFQ